MIKKAVNMILDANWPPSLQDSIITAAGLDTGVLEDATEFRRSTTLYDATLSLNGSCVARDWLLDYNGEFVRNPQNADQLPESEFVE